MDKDVVEGNTSIINSSKIEENLLLDTFITEFDEDFKVIRNIKADKININTKQWKILMQIFMKTKNI